MWANNNSMGDIPLTIGVGIPFIRITAVKKASYPKFRVILAWARRVSLVSTTCLCFLSTLSLWVEVYGHENRPLIPKLLHNWCISFIFTSIIWLKHFNSFVKLIVDIFNKVSECLNCCTFLFKGINPSISAKIIHK